MWMCRAGIPIRDDGPRTLPLGIAVRPGAATDPPDRARMMVTGWGSEDLKMGSELRKWLKNVEQKKQNIEI